MQSRSRRANRTNALDRGSRRFLRHAGGQCHIGWDSLALAGKARFFTQKSYAPILFACKAIIIRALPCPCDIFDSHRPLHFQASSGYAGLRDWGEAIDPMGESWEFPRSPRSESDRRWLDLAALR